MSQVTQGDNCIAAYYELYHKPDVRGFNLGCDRAPQVLKQLDHLIAPGSSCLDVGCGDGHVVGPWAIARNIRYVGVDIAESAVELVRTRGLEAFRVEDSGILPFSDRSFDAAISLEVIEHLFQPEATIREALRVVKPGGLLFVTTPNVAYWRRRMDFALIGRWNPFGYNLAVREPWNDPHIRFFNTGSLSRFLKKVGCEQISVLGQGGNLSSDLPWVGQRLFRKRPAQGSRGYMHLEQLFPSLFGCFLIGVGRKPLAAAGQGRGFDPTTNGSGSS